MNQRSLKCSRNLKSWKKKWIVRLCLMLEVKALLKVSWLQEVKYLHHMQTSILQPVKIERLNVKYRKKKRYRWVKWKMNDSLLLYCFGYTFINLFVTFPTQILHNKCIMLPSNKEWWKEEFTIFFSAITLQTKLFNRQETRQIPSKNMECRVRANINLVQS